MGLLNGQSLEVMEEFFYLGEKIEARGWTVDSALAKVRDAWRKFRISHRRYSVRKGVLRNFAKFTGKYLCQNLFLIKLQA